MFDARNVLGGTLETCGTAPMAGYFRDGCCNTAPEDTGAHVVCAEMNEAFLRFSASHGNDLSTPNPALGFSGLQSGDRWCVCAERWKEAFDAGVAPPVVLAATHISALEFVTLADLTAHAVDVE